MTRPEIKHRQIRRHAFRQRPGRHAENSRRIHAHLLDHLTQRENACPDQAGVSQRRRCLEPGDSERRAAEAPELLLPAVRRVIRADAVDRAVRQRLLQRLHILLRPERRIHLEIRVIARNIIGGQREVVRADLSGHMAPRFFRRPENLRGAGCRHMAEMETRAG